VDTEADGITGDTRRARDSTARFLSTCAFGLCRVCVTPVAREPGDVLLVAAGAIHAVKNVGSGTGAELATYVVEKREAAHYAGEVIATEPLGDT